MRPTPRWLRLEDTEVIDQREDALPSLEAEHEEEEALAAYDEIHDPM